MPFFERLAKALDVQSAVISGKVHKSKRPGIVKDYRAGEHQVLFATLQTMSALIDLTNTRHVVIYDKWWNPQIEHQAIARAVRRGQRHTVHMHRLHARDTLYRLLSDRQAFKMAMFDSVLNGNIHALRHQIEANTVRRVFQRTSCAV